MLPPHFRRHAEFLSHVLNLAPSLMLVLVAGIQHVQLQTHNQEIENLRADIATIRLNLATPTSNVQPSSNYYPTLIPTE